MRPGLKKTLEGYGDVAKNMETKTSRELGPLSNVLDFYIKQAVERSGSSENIQFEIFTLQQKKQRIMQQLKDALKELDNPEAKFERQPDAHLIYEHNGQYFRSQDHGEDLELTPGEILTDGE